MTRAVREKIEAALRSLRPDDLAGQARRHASARELTSLVRRLQDPNDRVEVEDGLAGVADACVADGARWGCLPFRPTAHVERAWRGAFIAWATGEIQPLNEALRRRRDPHD